MGAFTARQRASQLTGKLAIVGEEHSLLGNQEPTPDDVTLAKARPEVNAHARVAGNSVKQAAVRSTVCNACESLAWEQSVGWGRISVDW